MSSFSCPHLDLRKDSCERLKTDCVPGRPGCVLPKNLVFAVPVEERLRRKEEERRARGSDGTPGETERDR